MQKFKPDDKIALKVYENRPIDKCEHIYKIVNLYKTEKGEEQYTIEFAEPADLFRNTMALEKNYIEKTYIDISNALWYFEKKDADGKWAKLDDYRHTIKEVEKTFGKDKFPKFIQPIYTLGFKLS